MQQCHLNQIHFNNNNNNNNYNNNNGASEVTTSWRFAYMIIIIIICYQGETRGGSKITKENYETCLEVNPTLAGHHQ